MSAWKDRRGSGPGAAALRWAAAVQIVAAAALLAGCDECVTDADCESGRVCEPVANPGGGGPGEQQNQCVTGCHEDGQCGNGEHCEAVVCITTPCPGQCAASDGCTDDADCASGTVCELSTGCNQPARCVPGCHDTDQCGGGETCRTVECITCPCPGTCEPDESACAGDADCSTGFVCELSTGCQAPSRCVAGCHADAECSDGQHCQQLQCLTCPCPGVCAR